MTETAPITDEAARKANTAYWEALLMQSTQELDNDDAQHIAAIRAALEAALPYLTPQPVASRERVAEVLATHTIECTGLGEVTCRGCRELSWMLWHEYRTHVADALLAAGVFREPPTREQVEEALRPIFEPMLRYLNRGVSFAEQTASVDGRTKQAAEAVLALIGGDAK